MKLRNAVILAAAAILVLAAGIAIGLAAGGHWPGDPAPSTLAASPEAQTASSPSIHINLPESSGVKSISDASNLIESVTEGNLPSGRSDSGAPSDGSTGCFYRSFVIKFKQAMDAGTLNPQNISAFIDANPTEVRCTYSAGLKELQIDIKIDGSQADVNAVAIYVLLAKNIKTADGKTIGNDYGLTVANNG